MLQRTNNLAPAGFGRREFARTARTAHATRPAQKFVARYQWKISWVAIGILATGLGGARDLVDTSPSGLKLMPLTGFDPALMWAGCIGMILIGATWLLKGLLRAPALTMSHATISGFTLLGTKTIRWADIDRLELAKQDVYGKLLRIHARRGTPSSSIWLNCIELAVETLDRDVDEIIAEIYKYRPDLEGQPMHGAVRTFLSRLTS